MDSKSKSLALKDLPFAFFILSLVFILFPWGLVGGTFVGGGTFFEYRGASYVLIITTLLLFLSVKKGFDSKKTGVSLYIILLAAAVAVSFNKMSNIYASSEFAILLCTVVGLGFISVYYSYRTELRDSLVRVLVLLMTALSAYGLFQYFALYRANLLSLSVGQGSLGVDNRVTSVLTSPNAFASLCLLFWPLFLFMIIKHKEKKAKIVFFLCSVILFLAFALTFSRTAFAVAFLQSVIAAIFFWRRDRKISYAVISFVVLIIVTTGLFTLFKGFGIPSYQALLSSAVTSFMGRVSLWIGASRMIIDNPLTGAGAGAFSSVFLKYQIDGFYSLFAHNAFIQAFAETGVIGFISLVGLVLYIVIKCCVKNMTLSASKFIGLGLVGVFLHNMMDFSLFLPLVAYVVAVMAGIALAQVEAPLIKHRDFPKAAFIAGFVLLLMICLFMNIAYYLEHYGLKMAYEGNERGIYFLQLATVFNPIQAQHRSSLAEAYSVLFTNRTDQRVKRIYEARRASFLEPYNPEFYANLAYFYLDENQPELAIYFLKKATEVAPIQPFYYYSIAEIYVDLANLGEAKEFLRKSISYLGKFKKDYILQSYRPRGLPTYTDPLVSIGRSYILLGKIYTTEGNYDRALENYYNSLKIYPDSPEAYTGITTVELRRGKYAEANKSAEKALLVDANSAFAWYLYGQSFEGLKNNDLAKKAYEKALEIDPNYDLARVSIEKLMEGEKNEKNINN